MVTSTWWAVKGSVRLVDGFTSTGLVVLNRSTIEGQLQLTGGSFVRSASAPQNDNGHAIEARVNAEDAARDFLPTAGRVLSYRRPADARVDDAIESGVEVTTTYDSMLAKVIVHAEDRPTALAELDHALAQTAILGVTTTVGFLRSVIATDEVRAGRLDTELIARLQPLTGGPPADEVALAAALISLALLDERRSDDPFQSVDGWRLSGRRASSWWRLTVGSGEAAEVQLTDRSQHDPQRTGPHSFALTIAGERSEWSYATDGEVIWLGSQGYTWPVPRSTTAAAQESESGGDLRAPMPGQVLLVPATVGDAIRAGEPIVVLESMKMELVMAAPIDGTVAELSVAVGDKVVVDQPLARVEAPA